MVGWGAVKWGVMLCGQVGWDGVRSCGGLEGWGMVWGVVGWVR